MRLCDRVRLDLRDYVLASVVIPLLLTGCTGTQFADVDYTVVTDSYILDTSGTVDEPDPADSSRHSTSFSGDWLLTGLDVSLISGGGSLPTFTECRFFLRRDLADTERLVLFRQTWIDGRPESAHYNFADPIRINSGTSGTALVGLLGTTDAAPAPRCRALVVVRGRQL